MTYLGLFYSLSFFRQKFDDLIEFGFLPFGEFFENPSCMLRSNFTEISHAKKIFQQKNKK